MCSETRARCEPATEQPLLHLRACLAGDRSAISPVVQSLMEALREFPSAAAADFAVETALREALANAVIHGCRNDAAQLVECTLSCNPCGEVHIVVRDAIDVQEGSVDLAAEQEPAFRIPAERWTLVAEFAGEGGKIDGSVGQLKHAGNEP